MKKRYVKVDSRNRVCLTKVLKDVPDIFQVFVKEGAVILKPVQEIPEREKWLFEPENREILQEVLEGLKQKKVISRGSFEQYLNDKDD